MIKIFCHAKKHKSYKIAGLLAIIEETIEGYWRKILTGIA